MDTISAQGQVGKEEIRYFYGFIRSPVIAHGFLKLSQTPPQCYEDLVSHLNKKLIDPVLKALQTGGQQAQAPAGGGDGQEETRAPGLSLAQVGLVIITPVM